MQKNQQEAGEGTQLGVDGRSSCCVLWVQGALHTVAQPVGLGGDARAGQCWSPAGLLGPGLGKDGPSPTGQRQAALLCLSQPHPPHPACELRDTAEVTGQRSRGLHWG